MGIDRNEEANRKWKPPHPSGKHGPVPEAYPAGAAVAGSSILLTPLYELLRRCDGWLRVSPADEGKTVYVKWKWTVGPLANRYVMAVGTPSELLHLFALVVEKAEDAETGRGPTSQDKYYNGS